MKAETTDRPATTDGAGFRLFSRPVLSWAFYDFANTIFSMAVVTRYFNEWIVQKDGVSAQGNPDWYLAAMTAVVTVALVVTMPAFGAIADRYGARKPFLVAFTLLSVVATVGISVVDTTMAALVVGGIAVFGFQSAMVHYDPLLATVAPHQARGQVSGFGVGLGYFGALFGLGVLMVIVGDGDKQHAFLPTALMYMVFALPCFLFVRERRVVSAGGESVGAVVSKAFRQLSQTARHISRYRDIVRFLVGRMLYVDSLAVVIVFMTIFMDRLGYSEISKTLVLVLSMTFAGIGGIVIGRVIDRVGPRRVLLVVLSAFSMALLVMGVLGWSWLVWLLGPIVGVGLGGVWSSDRVFMMRLTPPEMRGEFFSIYNLMGKLGTAIGPALFAGTTWVLHDRGDWTQLSASRAGLVVVMFTAIAGMLIIRPLSDHARDWPGDPLEQQLEHGALA